MDFSFGSFQTERVAELLGKAIGVVASRRKPRALLRSVEREAAHHRHAARSNRTCGRRHVRRPSSGIHQEVEYRSVVPCIPLTFRLPIENVGHDERDLLSAIGESIAHLRQRRLADIEQGQISETGIQQRIRQWRRSSTNVDHRRRAWGSTEQ